MLQLRHSLARHLHGIAATRLSHMMLVLNMASHPGAGSRRSRVFVVTCQWDLPIPRWPSFPDPQTLRRSLLASPGPFTEVRHVNDRLLQFFKDCGTGGLGVSGFGPRFSTGAARGPQCCVRIGTSITLSPSMRLVAWMAVRLKCHIDTPGNHLCGSLASGPR